MPVKNFHADLERLRPVLPWSKIRVNDIDFTLVTNVSTSEMYVDENKKFILKKLKTHGGGNCIRREAHILKILNLKGFEWAPELVYSKDETMITKYIGSCVDKKNIPSDYKSQVEKILQNLRETGVEHNDISPEEILIKSGVIHLCDFGKIPKSHR